MNENATAVDATFIRNVEAIGAAIEEKNALIAMYRHTIDIAFTNLARLVPVPSRATVDDWPVDNPADAECLQMAFAELRAVHEASS